MLRLDEKIAFVSGVGSVGPGWGNGKATAVLFGRQGASVFGTDVNESAAEDTKSIIEAEGSVCEVRHCDATDSSQITAAVHDCTERFGRIDILVNNVGGSAPGGAASMTEKQWDSQIDLNLKTCYLMCHNVLPIMLRAGGGVIVNLSSVAGIREHLGRVHSAYTASKAAIIALTRSIAIEHARDNIRCNTVVPGLMHTPLVEARLSHQIASGDTSAFLESRANKVPMGRQGDAWDVAHAILFLVSNEARYITAQTIVVDGGYSAVTP